MLKSVNLFSLTALFVLASACTQGDGPEEPQKPEVPENLVEMPSGLQYFDNDVGTGEVVEAGVMLRTHYLGWVIKDGTKDLYHDWSKDSTKLQWLVDDSYEANRPYIFTIGQGEAIKGWEEGLIGMREGGTRTLIIPDSLAYGDEGVGNDVPPNSNLRYVVELLDLRRHAIPFEVPVDARREKTPEGVEVIHVEEGEGRMPNKGDLAVFHVNVWGVADTTLYNSTVEVEMKQTVPVGVSPTIEGLDIGLLRMKAGGKARLIVPPSLAFGNKEEVNGVPPGTTLMLDVELFEVRDAPNEDF